MEKSIREAFGLEQPDLRQLPVLNLAYVGDSVYELILRTAFTEKNTLRGAALNRQIRKYVCAEGQAAIITGLLPELTEEEAALYRRGRNAKPESIPRHAGVKLYLMATGFEALLGWLYLQGRTERALELVRKGLKYAEQEKL